MNHLDCMSVSHLIRVITCILLSEFKTRCWEPPGRYLCIPEPGRPGCVISIEIGVKGDVYPVAISQKVTKNLPVSFYSPRFTESLSITK